MTSPENGDALAVTPEPGTRLAQLLSLYDTYRDALDLATVQLKQITDAIKTELTGKYTHVVNARDDDVPYRRYQLTAETLRSPLSLTWIERTTLDTKALKRDYPGIEQTYGRTTGSWTLKRQS